MSFVRKSVKSKKNLSRRRVMANKQNLGSEPRITLVQFSGQLRLSDARSLPLGVRLT